VESSGSERKKLKDSREFSNRNKSLGVLIQSWRIRYLLAVHSKSENTVTILPKPTSLYTLNPVVKSLKNLPAIEYDPTENFIAARNELMSTFGSKRSMRAIKNREKNIFKVGDLGKDSRMQEGIREVVELRSPKKTSGTSNDLNDEEMDESRGQVPSFLPPFDAKTTNPGGIYSLSSIIPELNSISIKTIEKADDPTTYLPFKSSTYVNERLRKIWHHANTANNGVLDGDERKRVKLLVYVCVMIVFFKVSWLLTDETSLILNVDTSCHPEESHLNHWRKN
jgi:hypothetical protein